MAGKKPQDKTDGEDRYIIWEGPNAESLQFWEDDWHDHHDRMSSTHNTCPDCGHDLTNWTGWSKPVKRQTQ